MWISCRFRMFLCPRRCVRLIPQSTATACFPQIASGVWDLRDISLRPGHWNIAPLPKVAGSCICFHNSRRALEKCSPKREFSVLKAVGNGADRGLERGGNGSSGVKSGWQNVVTSMARMSERISPRRILPSPPDIDDKSVLQGNRYHFAVSSRVVYYLDMLLAARTRRWCAPGCDLRISSYFRVADVSCAR